MTQDAATNGSTDVEESRSPDEGADSPTHVESLDRRVDALSTQIVDLRGSLESAQQGRDDLRDVIDALREENAALRERVDRLDARTDLLELVESADSLDGEQRSVALVQHLKRAAERQRDRGQSARASVNRDEAEAALHHPNVDRTSIYDDMRRAVRLVGNEDVLWYTSGTNGETRLKLDVESADLPLSITGQAADNGGQ